MTIIVSGYVDLSLDLSWYSGTTLSSVHTPFSSGVAQSHRAPDWPHCTIFYFLDFFVNLTWVNITWLRRPLRNNISHIVQILWIPLWSCFSGRQVDTDPRFKNKNKKNVHTWRYPSIYMLDVKLDWILESFPKEPISAAVLQIGRASCRERV